MAETRRVSKFRSELSSGMRSGTNAIAVASAVNALKSGSELLACLDIWCDLFKPAEWPEKNRVKKRAQFEQARSAGEILFVRAMAFADSSKELANMVAQMPSLQALPMAKGDEAKPYRRYANRYALLSDASKAEVGRHLRRYYNRLADTIRSKKLLCDSIDQLYLERNAVKAKSLEDLIDLTFDEPEKRRRFEQLAQACQNAWNVSARERKWVTASQMITAAAKGDVIPVSDAESLHGKIANIHSSFEQFAKWVKADMRTPLDFFRLASWAREPSDKIFAMNAKKRKTTTKPFSGWNGVWEELYLEIVSRALNKSLAQWKIESMYSTSGFVGRDRSFLEYPLGEQGRKLFWNRLQLADQRKTFDESNFARRQAFMVATHNGLQLLDEFETVKNLDLIKEQLRNNLVWVSKRSVEGIVNNQPQTWWMFQRVEDAFTVLWIDPGRGGKKTTSVLVDIPAAPGFMFKSYWPFSGLSNIHQNAFYRDLAKRAQILAAGALALLKVLGYVFDFATAAMGGGGIRMIVFRFVGELVLDETVELGLDAVDIQNPWLRATIQLGVNFVPKPGIDIPSVKSIEEIDLDLARRARTLETEPPKLNRDVGDGVSSSALRQGDAPNPKGTGKLDLDKDINEIAPITNAVMDKHSVKKLMRDPDPGENIVDQIGDTADNLARRLFGEKAPLTAPAGSRSIATYIPDSPSNLYKVSGTEKKARATGSRGAGPVKSARPNQKTADRLSNSELFETLKRYDELLDSKTASVHREARARIIEELATDTSKKMTRSKSIKQLENMLNHAKAVTGEYVALTTVLGNLNALGVKVANVVSIPRRRNGVPVFDLVLTVPGKPKKFIFIEAKGGEATSLGKVRASNYNPGDTVTAIRVEGSSVRQTSGEWYFQRIVEIQNLGGKANQALALEMFEAMKNGNARYLLIKSGVSMDPSILFDVRPAEWVAQTRWVGTNGKLPIPVGKYGARVPDRRSKKGDYADSEQIKFK